MDAVSFHILINGTELGGQYGLTQLVVSHAVGKIPMAKIIFLDGDSASADFPHSNEDQFAPGAEIQVNAGVGSDSQPIFKGIIIKQSIKINSYESPTLEIECRDTAIKMSGARKNKVFNDMSDSEIIEEMIDAASLEKDVDSISDKHKEMVQYNCTDWDFMVTRAEMNGKWVLVNQGKVEVKAPPSSGTAEVTINVGLDTYEFEAQIDARNQYPNVKTKTWNYTNQEITESESSEPSTLSQGDIEPSSLSDVMGWEEFPLVHGGKIVEAENQAWANGRLLLSRLSKVQGRVKVTGNNTLKTGTLISLQGFGNRYNGTTVATAVNHYFSNVSGWYTDIQFGIQKEPFANRYSDIMEQPASGLVPAINGLHIGIVTAIHEDPDGESRIKVKMPLVDNEGEGIWARLSSPDAGSERGWVFYPEINDEVILGFLNNDPRNAIILGRLYSSSIPPFIEATEDNFEKGLLTKSGIKMVFNDDKKIFNVETPGGYKFTMDEDEGKITVVDGNSNSIEMSSDGIKIESGKDIILKATGDVKIEGVNVSAKASAQFKAEGSAGGELSSSGTTKVKGSLVQIN